MRKDSVMDKHKHCGQVDSGFMSRVEKYQDKTAIRLGLFDTNLLMEFIEQIQEIDVAGEVEVFVMPDNKMPDGKTAGLIVVQCNGGKHHFALAGMGDP